MKTITKEQSKKAIMVYYSLTIIFISIGLYTKQSMWYVVGVIFLALALIRKYWLMRRLKN